MRYHMTGDTMDIHARRCATCRYWSEMMVSVIIDYLLDALCQNAASQSLHEMVTGDQSCLG